MADARERGVPAVEDRRTERLVILDTSIKMLFHSMLVLALYFLFAGHNQPGGGFVGGLMAGAALSLRYVSGGAAAVRSTFRFPAHHVLGLGLAVAAGTAFLPVLLGHSVLEHADLTVEPPVLGTIKVTSALPFDIGVFLIVVGLVMMAFDAFGDELIEEQSHPEKESS